MSTEIKYSGDAQKGLEAFSKAEYEIALKYFFLAITDDPRNVDLWIFSAVALYKQMRLQQAKSCLEFALEIEANNGKALNLYSGVLSQLGEHEKALHFADLAISQRPNDPGTWRNRAFAIAGSCNDRQRIYNAYSEWGRKFSDPIFNNSDAAIPVDNNPDKKLRIGYVSGDLRSHSVAFFIAPYFEYHDRENYEFFIYSTMFEDQISESMKEHVESWTNVESLDDRQLHKKITDDHIDILVDLSGHTAGNRLNVFSMRAAPIQVTWLGFMYTLGMKAIDYRITDFGIDPLGSEKYYVEKLFRLSCMATYVPPYIYPIPDNFPCEDNGYVTMISLNHTRKIGDEVLKTWKTILNLNNNSGLIIVAHEATLNEANANFKPRLEKLNFPLDRVVIMPKLPLDEFMQLSKIADLSLDSFPVSGGTTTMHALWMGLPVIAMNDDCAASSSSAKTLLGIGLEECVANNENEYIKIVSNLINDLDGLKSLRLKTRKLLEASQLMDYKSRVSELQTAYRQMWLQYLSPNKKN